MILDFELLFSLKGSEAFEESPKTKIVPKHYKVRTQNENFKKI